MKLFWAVVVKADDVDDHDIDNHDEQVEAIRGSTVTKHGLITVPCLASSPERRTEVRGLNMGLSIRRQSTRLVVDKDVVRVHRGGLLR